MRKLLALLYVTSIFVVGQICHGQVYNFRESQGIVPLLQQFATAQYSIEVYAFVITDEQVVNALIAAKNRNVQVEVILDASQMRGNKYSLHQRLIDAHIALAASDSPIINTYGVIDRNISFIGPQLMFTDMRANPKSGLYQILRDPNMARRIEEEIRNISTR